MKEIFSLIFICFFSTLNANDKLFSFNKNIKQFYIDKKYNAKVNTLVDTYKTITIFVVSNKTDETIAKIEVIVEIKNKKIKNANAKVVANNLDGINAMQHLALSIENELVILQVNMNGRLSSSNRKWIGDVSASILLGLTSEENLKSFTLNENKSVSDIRFGGDFLNQANGIFLTINFKCNIQ